VYEHLLLVDDLAPAGGSDFDLDEAAAAVGPDDLLTLIYTSGTTRATPTMKLKRRPIAEKYTAEIEALYQPR
jgi:long-subunit acyl-CoA synthetase (AMP-forming)